MYEMWQPADGQKWRSKPGGSNVGARGDGDGWEGEDTSATVRRTSPPSVYHLLRYITKDEVKNALDRAIKNQADELFLELQSQHHEWLTNISLMLDCTDKSLAPIHSVHSHYVASTKRCGFQNSSLVLHNQRVLILETLLWRWAVSSILEGMKEFNNPSRNSDVILLHWTRPLIRVVEDAILRHESAWYAPENVFPDPLPAFLISKPFFLKACSGYPEHPRKEIAFLSAQMLAYWMSLSSSRARTSEVLIEHFGYNILLCLGLTEHLFESEGISDSDRLALRTYLSTAGEFSIDVLLQKMNKVLASHPSWVNWSQVSPFPVVASAQAFSANELSAIEFRALFPPGSTPFPPPAPHGDVSSVNFDRDVRLNAMSLQLYYLLPLINISIVIPPGSEGALQKFQHEVAMQSDVKLPFREWATCRAYYLEASDSPFHSPHLRETYGLFSVILFRAIFFGSPYLLTNPVHRRILFFNQQDFQRHYQTVLTQVGDKSHFKNNNSYGPWRRIDIENVPTYFHASQDPTLAAFLTSEPPAQFSHVFNTLLKTKLLPGLGPLTIYLIVADYASVGLIAMPTVAEMGKIIFQLKAGAYKCLGRLGFPTSTVGEAQFAFQSVYHDLESQFSLASATMPFNAITVEHSLCKFRRLNVNSFRKFVGAAALYPRELRFLEWCKSIHSSED